MTVENDSVCQERVIRFLASGEAFGQTPDEHIDTHISHVFLVGNHAYKLKRAVKLKFLDFTTLEARRIACEREIVINRRTAPEIYQGVAAITKAGSSFQLDGEGEAVDYIVVMNRFDDGTLFNRLCARNDLKGTLISDLAEQIAKLHLSSDMAPQFGGASSVENTFEGVAETLSPFEGSLFDSGAVSNWKLKMEAELLRQSRRLDMRRRTGFVRQCHGDLHLGNICLLNGRPTPFDAIEFGDEYSAIDVLYDLAFPIMDLVCARAFGHANLLMNRYLEVTSDYSGLHVMPLFMSLRAAVRAMVHALEFQSKHADTADQIAAHAYFDLAQACLERSPRKLIAVGGVSGTGKSLLARKLANSILPREGAIVLRSDAVRKHLFHQAALVPLPSRAYDGKANRRVFRALCRDAHRALMSGYSVIVDATFLDSEKRKTLEEIAAKKSIPFSGLWLEAEESVLLKRIAGRKSDVSDATRNVVLGQLERGAGDVKWNRLDASGPPPDVLSMAIEVLQQDQKD